MFKLYITVSKELERYGDFGVLMLPVYYVFYSSTQDKRYGVVWCLEYSPYFILRKNNWSMRSLSNIERFYQKQVNNV